MPKTSAAQRKTTGRVMHEFKHGELKSGPGGKAGEVDNPRQAIAIALHEAGASKYESDEENEETLEKTKEKEARGETGQQQIEGKARIGARGRRESSKAMGGKAVTRPAKRAAKSIKASAKPAAKKRSKSPKRRPAPKR